MRIWLVTQTLVNRPGGVATHVRLLQQGLQFCGHESHVISADAMPRPLARLLISLPMRVVNKLKRGAGIEYAMKFHSRNLERLLRGRAQWAQPPDAFGCQDLASAMAAARIRDQIAPEAPILLTIHSHYTFEKVGQGWMRPHSSGERRVLELERGGMLAADALVCVSDKMRDHVIDLIGPTVRPITSLHNSIDTERFSPSLSRRQQQRLRKQLGFDEDVPILLICGHLQEIKGVHIAVEAARVLRDSGEWFLMVFVGDGPLRSKMESMIRRYGLQTCVKLMGRVSHERIPTLLKVADMLLMPSIPTYRAEESFGLSAVEGMSCGLPVIASETGGLTEIVRHGENGLLVPPGDAEMLADSIKDLLEDPVSRVALGQSGRDYAVAHHDHVAHARQYASIAESWIGAAGGEAVVRMAG